MLQSISNYRDPEFISQILQAKANSSKAYNINYTSTKASGFNLCETVH